MQGRLTRRVVGALRARLPDAELQRVRDPRRRPASVRWPLEMILKFVVVGLIAGRRSLADLESLSKEMSPAARRALGLKGRLPDTTARDLVVAIEPDDVRGAMVRQVRQAHRRKALEPEGLPWGVVSMDGKTTAVQRWDKRYSQRQRHGGSASGACGLVRTVTSCLISSRARVCLDASPIPPSTNENGHFKDALSALLEAYEGLDLFRVVMYDSGACSEANARFIRSTGLHYVLCLNEAQPTLVAEARRQMASLPVERALAMSEDVRNGRLVRRYLFMTDEMAGYLDWSHLKTVLRVRSETLDHDGTVLTSEDHYYLSSLRPAALGASGWLQMIRRRWSVENQCHNTWDVAFEEDDKPWIVADPQGTLVLMILRRIAYNFLALYRLVTLRSEETRATPWRQLIRWFYNALIAATAVQLEGLRRRAPVPSATD